MPTSAEEIRAAVEQRFGQVVRSPALERFRSAPASARKLGYAPGEIALPVESGRRVTGVLRGAAAGVRCVGRYWKNQLRHGEIRR